MVLAISLIQVTPDQETAAYRTIKDVYGTKNIYHLFGDHDLLVIHEADCLSSLKKALRDIKELKFVNIIRTMVETPVEGIEANLSNIRNSVTSFKN